MHVELAVVDESLILKAATKILTHLCEKCNVKQLHINFMQHKFVL